MPLPGWLATTEHEPVRRSVIVAPAVPLEVQTAGVVVVNVTGSPEDALAVTVSGDRMSVLLPGLVKVILWLASETAKDTVFCGAAA